METNSLFPLKYRLRKTDEPVEIIAWETLEKGARSDSDWVSYIDAAGVEHVKERLTLEWDFVMDNPFEKTLLGGFGNTLSKIDVWEPRRYDMVQRQVIENRVPVEDALLRADSIIDTIKKAHPEPEPSSTVVYDPKKGL